MPKVSIDFHEFYLDIICYLIIEIIDFEVWSYRSEIDFFSVDCKIDGFLRLILMCLNVNFLLESLSMFSWPRG